MQKSLLFILLEKFSLLSWMSTEFSQMLFWNLFIWLSLSLFFYFFFIDLLSENSFIIVFKKLLLFSASTITSIIHFDFFLYIVLYFHQTSSKLIFGILSKFKKWMFIQFTFYNFYIIFKTDGNHFHFFCFLKMGNTPKHV